MVNHSKQKGFSILAVILVIVAVIVAIGVWAMSGQSNTSQNSSNKNDILAAAIVQDGAMYRLQFEKYRIEGKATSDVTFQPGIANTTPFPNILDPVNGVALTTVNKGAIRDGATTPEGMWVFMPTLEGNDFADFNAVVVAGVKDDVCKSINKIVNGKALLPNLAAALSNSKSLVVDATVANPIEETSGYVGFDPIIYPNFNSKEGCLKFGTAADQNIYFNTLRRYI